MLSRAQILRYLRLRYFGWASLALAFAASVFTLYLDSRVRSEFEGRRFALPARIYARPLELHAGLRIAQPDVEQEAQARSEEHTSELQSQSNLVCRLLLEKKKKTSIK